MRRWFSLIMSGRKAFSRRNRNWWAAMTEAVLAGALVLIGVVLLVVFLTLAVLYSTPTKLYISGGYFAIQIIAAVSLIAIGTYRVLVTFWKVGASAERRSAMVSRAGDFELLNEIRRRREETPTVPLDKHRPTRGENLRFQLVPSRRNLWGFGLAAIINLLFVSLATILILTAVASWRADSVDWLATGFAIPINLAAAWSIYNLFRQLLALTGVGPPALEVSRFPFVVGENYDFHLSQPGRVRLKLLDVILVCQEEATFNDGTDVRTEKKTVYEQRLLRKRGVNVKPAEPFIADFEMTLPRFAMHSFKSANNRVLWKIVIRGMASGWPKQERNFAISVLPRRAKPASKN